MKLRKAKRIVFLILFGGFAVIMIGVLIKKLDLIYLGFVIMGSSFIFDFIYSKCPYCKGYIRYVSWKHCPHCGNKLEV
ncbi:MAG: hypothetical protein QM204_01935 [Bacillota bacterium]|jgi:hypothetical protein|nr:hypothetical protein [Bacillota bacterium]NLL26131.1 hypothetical protein [Erysipelotrichia bacterium]